jgi:hypothetical protein
MIMTEILLLEVLRASEPKTQPVILSSKISMLIMMASLITKNGFKIGWLLISTEQTN